MKENVLSGKVIALGISGGIAAYKAVDLASKLTQEGTTVKTIMTRNATKFIGPVTFQAVTGQPVVLDIFEAGVQGKIFHTSVGKEADLVVVAPATANILAKTAHGIADDALLTTILAAQSPVVMVPAMNSRMWLNPATQDNLKVLRQRGIHIVEPDTGRLACGEDNVIGRFPEIAKITSYIKNLLVRSKDLLGKTIMVTAGGTREPIDPVRFIGNRSSGKMGYAIAEAAKSRGAEVLLVSGRTCLQPPAGVKIIDVETAREMYQAVMDNLDWADALVMAAAVADFRPSQTSAQKIKKGNMPESIKLELNPDILQAVAKIKKGKLIVGFAAESEDIIKNATQKLKKKSLDLIVANDIAAPGVGFGSDCNLAVIVDTNGPVGSLEVYQKRELADKILDWISASFDKPLISG